MKIYEKAVFKQRSCAKILVLFFERFGVCASKRQKKKALIFQGLETRRNPLFDKNVRKADFIRFIGSLLVCINPLMSSRKYQLAAQT